MIAHSREREKIGQDRPFRTMDGFWTIHSGEWAPRSCSLNGQYAHPFYGMVWYKLLLRGCKPQGS
eukprot:2232249-Pleurochrysis_carterae.AAC.2